VFDRKGNERMTGLMVRNAFLIACGHDPIAFLEAKHHTINRFLQVAHVNLVAAAPHGEKGGVFALMREEARSCSVSANSHVRGVVISDLTFAQPLRAISLRNKSYFFAEDRYRKRLGKMAAAFRTSSSALGWFRKLLQQRARLLPKQR